MSFQLRLSAAQIVGCAFQLRLETQRRVKFGNAFPRFAGGEQGQSQIVVRFGAVGIQPERFVKLLDSLRYSAHERQRESKVSTNVCVFGGKLLRAIHLLERGFIAVLLPQCVG